MRSTTSPPPIARDEPIQENVNAMVLQLRRRLRQGKLLTFREWLHDVRELLRHLK